jgi:hypothetical protein
MRRVGACRADDCLEIHIETADQATLERLQGVVTRHLKQVAATETFEVSWNVT